MGWLPPTSGCPWLSHSLRHLQGWAPQLQAVPAPHCLWVKDSPLTTALNFPSFSLKLPPPVLSLLVTLLPVYPVYQRPLSPRRLQGGLLSLLLFRPNIPSSQPGPRTQMLHSPSTLMAFSGQRFPDKKAMKEQTFLPSGSQQQKCHQNRLQLKTHTFAAPLLNHHTKLQALC